MIRTTSAVLVTAAVSCAQADIRITEWMYSGTGGEFIELTNVGNSPIDVTGWSFDDDSRTPGTFSLTGAGQVQPGESLVIAEDSFAVFTAAWSLVGVTVLGNLTSNLGRNDEINIYDAAGVLVDRLAFGDQNFPGTIRTQNFSGNPATPGALGANDPRQWALSFVGDAFGSYASANGDVGNPGIYVPGPGALALMGLGIMAAARRRRV